MHLVCTIQYMFTDARTSPPLYVPEKGVQLSKKWPTVLYRIKHRTAVDLVVNTSKHCAPTCASTNLFATFWEHMGRYSCVPMDCQDDEPCLRVKRWDKILQFAFVLAQI
jgi:hypothetical protein